MRVKTAKIFIIIVGIIFIADDIDVDITLSRVLNTVFHTTFNAIQRDYVENGTNRKDVGASTRTIASTNVIAVDEDSPTTLETYFPSVKNDTPAPEAKVVATSPGVVEVSYLTLHTLLI